MRDFAMSILNVNLCKKLVLFLQSLKSCFVNELKDIFYLVLFIFGGKLRYREQSH